ncbi:MAG: FG-GAP-like repeat-containing protein [Deltaproteobacteria bacterium]|nr:FG-GAP-like repeat-containing protein [Deltaproteobacteria bacterium]
MKIHLSAPRLHLYLELPRALRAPRVLRILSTRVATLGLLLSLGMNTAPATAQLSIFEFTLFPGATDSQMGRANAVGDFNNDGYDDLAVGLPGTEVNGSTDAGAVVVFYGGPGDWLSFDAITAELLGTVSQAGALLGLALATGDFDGDDHDDLAMSLPGRNVNGEIAAGQIAVVYGSPTALDLNTVQRFTQISLSGATEEEDLFGFSLAAGDLSADGIDDLAIGTPFEDIPGPLGPRENVGEVAIMYGVESTGLSPTGSLVINENSPGVGLNANTQEQFGFSLAIGQFIHNANTDLAVGTPGEVVFGAGRHGAVILFPGAPGGLDTVAGVEGVLSQMTPGVLGTLGDGDQFGFSLAKGNFDGDLWTDLAIGVPGESQFGPSNSGAVQILYGNAVGLNAAGNQILLESTIDNDVDVFDRLGTAVAAGDFNNDGRDDLAMGAPSDDSLGVADSGEVTIVYGTNAGLSFDGHQIFNMIFFDTLDSGEFFGSALSAGRFFNRSPAQDLAVGIPEYAEVAGSPTGASLVIRSRSIFSDGFESGDLSQWPTSAP